MLCHILFCHVGHGSSRRSTIVQTTLKLISPGRPHLIKPHSTVSSPAEPAVTAKPCLVSLTRTGLISSTVPKLGCPTGAKNHRSAIDPGARHQDATARTNLATTHPAKIDLVGLAILSLPQCTKSRDAWTAKPGLIQTWTHFAGACPDIAYPNPTASSRHPYQMRYYTTSPIRDGLIAPSLPSSIRPHRGLSHQDCHIASNRPYLFPPCRPHLAYLSLSGLGIPFASIHDGLVSARTHHSAPTTTSLPILPLFLRALAALPAATTSTS